VWPQSVRRAANGYSRGSLSGIGRRAKREISAATYSPTPSEGSTIGAEGLCFRVRNGGALRRGGLLDRLRRRCCDLLDCEVPEQKIAQCRVSRANVSLRVESACSASTAADEAQ